VSKTDVVRICPYLRQFGSLTLSVPGAWLRWHSINLEIPPPTFSKDDERAPPFADHEAARAKWHTSTSQRQYLTDHIHFINYQSKQILLLDLANCSAAQVGRIFQAVPEFVATRPRDSLLIVSDFTGASFDPDAVRVMKEAAVFDKPYVKKSAWTGTGGVPPALART
jgi:hypothetical protein